MCVSKLEIQKVKLVSMLMSNLQRDMRMWLFCLIIILPKLHVTKHPTLKDTNS